MKFASMFVAGAALTTFAIIGHITIDDLPSAVRASQMVNISSAQPGPYVVPQGRTLVMTGLQPSAYMGNTSVAIVTVNGVPLVREELAPFVKGVTFPPNLFAPSGAAVVVSAPQGLGSVILTGYLD